MTMVIDVGLARYFYSEGAPMHELALQRLVEQGFTRKVRDFIGDGVYEALRFRNLVRTRYLDADERDAVKVEYDALPQKDVDFAWSETDSMGLFVTQELALRLEKGAPKQFEFEHLNHHANVEDVRRQLKSDWSGARSARRVAVAKMHRFASKHHMIIHTA